MVRRRLALVEGWAGDAANARAEPDHSRDDHLFGLPACVACYEGEADYKGGLVGAGQVAGLVRLDLTVWIGLGVQAPT